MDLTQPNRIPLPGGHWADLRPASDITERLRRPIKKLSTQLGQYPEFVTAVSTAQKQAAKGKELSQSEQLKLAAAMGPAFDVLEELQDRLVVAVVRGWSFEIPEITVDSVLDLPSAALDALREAVAPYQTALNPDFTPNIDEDSPTAPSGV